MCNMIPEVYPMHEAARQGDAGLLQQLLAQGRNANEINYDSVTPLHEACLAGQIHCIQILLNAGARVNARNIDGSTPLCDACSHGSIECVTLLLRHGATVNPELNYTSPLHEAVLKDNWEVAEILVRQGANLDANDLHFGSPLHVCAFKGHINSARVLLMAGCNVNISKMHQTPLHTAALKKHLGLVHLLLEYGANANAVNNQGKLPADFVHKSSLIHHCLKKYSETPRSLLETCRFVIRKTVFHHKRKHYEQRVSVLDNLPLPKQLVSFIAHNLS